MSTFVASSAKADSKTKLVGNASIEEHAEVSNAILSGDARVHGSATVENAILRNDVQVYDKAEVKGILFPDEVAGFIIMSDNCHIFGNAKLVNNIEGRFALILKGECKFGGNATTDELVDPLDFIEKYGSKKAKIRYDREDSIILGSTVTLTDVWDMG